MGVAGFGVCTRSGDVLLERSFPALSASGRVARRASLRAALRTALPSTGEEEEAVALLDDDASLVAVPASDLVFFALGAGEACDELELAALARGLLAAARSATAKAGFLSAEALLESAAFTRFCVLCDEVAPEGTLENTNPAAWAPGVRLRPPGPDAA